MAGALRSLVASTCSIFRAIGKPKIETMWQVIRLSIIVILIYPLTAMYGISGTSVVILLSTFISGIGFGFEVLRITGCGFKNLSKLIVLPLLNGTIIVAIIYALKFFINAYTFLGFFSLTGVSILIFIGINYLFYKFFNYEILLTIKKGLDAFRN